MAKRELKLLPSIILQPDGSEVLFDSLSPEERRKFIVEANRRAFAAIGMVPVEANEEGAITKKNLHR